MVKRRTSRRDPIDSVIESGLAPGDYIGWNEGFSFCANLRHLEGEIAKVVDADPARAVTLYETFLAGCNAKAEEVDDSDGEFATFVRDLYCAWIKARQAAGADGDRTAKLLLAWLDDDPYGFCHDLSVLGLATQD